MTILGNDGKCIVLVGNREKNFMLNTTTMNGVGVMNQFLKSKMPKKLKPKSELFSLMNVGPATYKDLETLGIHSIQQLSKANPDILYSRLQELTGKPHDPCVWDVFAAIIHEAKTGEKTPWWQWTAIRKKQKST